MDKFEIYSSIYIELFLYILYIDKTLVFNVIRKTFIFLLQCDPAGCLIELCIQLGIVMVGKQILNNTKEIIIP